MKRVILCGILVLLGLPVQAQYTPQSVEIQSEQKSKEFWNNLIIDASFSMSARHHHIYNSTMGMNVGYEFVPRLYAFGHAEANLALRDQSGLRTWYRTPILGGGLGYSLFRTEWESLDLRVMGLTSVGKKDWKQNAVDAGFVCSFLGKHGHVRPLLGLGYRFVNSRMSGIRNHSTIYASVGFSF